MTGQGAFRLLVRHFLGRFFRTEHGRLDEAAREKFSGVLAALTVVCPIVFFTLLTLYLFIRFDVENMWPLGVHYFGVAMIASGFMAIVAWDDLLPDEVDQAVLAVLPIPRSTMMWAKATAVGILMGVGTLALSALTPFVFAIYLLPAGGTAGQFWRLLAGYFLSASLACLLTFFTCGALRGASLLLPSWRGVRRASSWLQSALAFALIGGFALLPTVSRHLFALAEGDSPALLFMPPAWYVGLTQVIVGQTSPVFVRLALMALVAPVVAGLLFVGALTLGFRRFAWLKEDTGRVGGADRREGLVARTINTLALRTPQARAAFWFFVFTLWRGPRQRLRLLSYIGAAAGWIFVVQAAGGDGLAYSAAIAGFLAVAGARSSAGAICQERAGWIIRMTETDGKGSYLAGVRLGLWLAVLAPTFLALALVLVAFGGFERFAANPWPLLGAHLLFNFLAACLLAEGLIVASERLPFTALPGPGKFHVPVLFLLGFYTYVKVLGTLEILLLTTLADYVIAIAAAACTLGAVLFIRRSASGPFIYQEADDLIDYGLARADEE